MKFIFIIILIYLINTFQCATDGTFSTDIVKQFIVNNNYLLDEKLSKFYTKVNNQEKNYIKNLLKNDNLSTFYSSLQNKTQKELKELINQHQLTIDDNEINDVVEKLNDNKFLHSYKINKALFAKQNNNSKGNKSYNFSFKQINNLMTDLLIKSNPNTLTNLKDNLSNLSNPSNNKFVFLNENFILNKLNELFTIKDLIESINEGFKSIQGIKHKFIRNGKIIEVTDDYDREIQCSNSENINKINLDELISNLKSIDYIDFKAGLKKVIQTLRKIIFKCIISDKNKGIIRKDWKCKSLEQFIDYLFEKVVTANKVIIKEGELENKVDDIINHIKSKDYKNMGTLIGKLFGIIKSSSY